MLFFSFSAPFAAVVDAGDTRHAEEQRINEGKMLFVGQVACDADDVVVIHKVEQMLSLVERPVFRAELAQKGMADLEQVHGI